MYGGLPQVVLADSPEKKEQYLCIQAANVYLNDIVDRYDLRNESLLHTLTQIVSSNIGCLTSPNKLANTFASVTGADVSRRTLTVGGRFRDDDGIITLEIFDFLLDDKSLDY